jgi:ABC-type transport system involved in cytochrome c biogenesis permease subunit
LFFAALSGAVYLAINRVESRSSSSPSSTKEPLNYWKKIRFQLICVYLLFGFLSFTAAIIFGVFKANIYWKNYWRWDIKIVFNFIMWTYYFVVVAMIPILKFKKYEKREQLVSVFSITGIAFIVFNFIFSYFSKVHRYL